MSITQPATHEWNKINVNRFIFIVFPHNFSCSNATLEIMKEKLFMEKAAQNKVSYNARLGGALVIFIRLIMN